MKNYEEIANSIFERREEYIAQQKKESKILIGILTTMFCSLIVLITGIFILQNGYFRSGGFVLSNSSYDTSSKDKNYYSSSSWSKPYETDSSSSWAKPYETDSSSTPSKPIASAPDYFIDSIDKVNFYSAKKIISENSDLPITMSDNGFSPPRVILLTGGYAEYPIDRNKVFTITMVTYFTMKLNDEKGFLAQKLGGTGLVEVVVTKNNLDDMGQMITFKREDKYYTCLLNGGSYDVATDKTWHDFSSHIYISGFNIIKNKNQENYSFTVHYEGSKVTGFECAPFQSTPSKYKVDDVTFVEDYCVVLFTKQNFTIDQLEVYFKNESTSS